jgi:hypothetical protein
MKLDHTSLAPRRDDTKSTNQLEQSLVVPCGDYRRADWSPPNEGL